MAGTVLASALFLHLLMTALAFEMELLPAMPKNKISAHLGDPLVLTCRTTGCDSPSFVWRTEMDYPLSAVVQTAGSQSNLTMERVGFQHERLYLCTAICGSLRLQKRAQIEVYSFPHAPIIATGGALMARTHSVISCTVPDVYPSDLLKVELMKDGQILEELPYDSERSLKTKNLAYSFIPTPEDDGKEFICLAELSFDDPLKKPQQRQSRLKISVNYIPQNIAITVTPSSTVREGESLTLNCTAQGNPPARIIWTKQSTNKSLNPLEGRNSFTIPNAEFSDSGLYVCEARNEAGSAIVQTEVSVQGEPKIPHLSIFPSTTVKEGNNIIIQCFAEGNPAAEITLKKKLEDGDIVLEGANGTVHIPEVQSRDAGLYECEAENTFGKKKTSVSLTVEFPPRETTLVCLPSETVKEGDTVVISCTSASVPAPHIILKKKTEVGETVLNSVDGIYTIQKVQEQHAGTYTCEAINALGQQSRTIKLDVKVPPRNTIVHVSPSEKVTEGDNVTITCRTYCNPPPLIILKKVFPENETIQSSNNGTFTLYRVTKSDTGTYIIDVSNDVGNDTEVIKIYVMEKMEEPKANSLGLTLLLCVTSLALTTATAAAIAFYKFKQGKLKGSYSLIKALRMRV